MADRTSFAADTTTPPGAFDLERLLADRSEKTPAAESPARIDGTLLGTLIALASNGSVPLITYEGQAGTQALEAQTTVDLHGSHIGRPVVLMFEDGNPLRPIVIGCVRKTLPSALDERPGSVEIEADGERLIVSAKNQIVLRCGKASITLTRAGKILIEGSYVSNRSSGVLRLKGGSVQIN
jgi:hypothetical protein